MLQATLLQAQPVAPGLELTVLDGSLEDDQGYSLTWGSTRAGAARPADASHGGLLRPARCADRPLDLAGELWPGVREALSAGLWVVASDAGAMADPIRPWPQRPSGPRRRCPGSGGCAGEVGHSITQRLPLIAFGGERPPLHQELDQLYRGLLNMSDALSQDSELAAASWLRDPLDADHQDEWWPGMGVLDTATWRQPLSALFEQLEKAFATICCRRRSCWSSVTCSGSRAAVACSMATAAAWFRPVASAASCASASCRSCNGIA